ncbi:NAC domain transcriptional regulator superfamily protein [Tripterygium wilfordii]|uniref:NAC domain transcriptional regulator superfamily protein n=1 Tax=Tripterygium wilfordii TaxID=458696 RepID=A0A7J7CYX2_TRIWF|nr:NAC domain transcriptional regulator superfamily protein [Tripterygium wilfordii]
MVCVQEEWVICRIFHKTGEKKNGFFQGHGYLLESAASFPLIPSSSSSPPPLLETPIHQKPFLLDHHHRHENPDLKYLINTTISQPDQLLKTNVFAPSFSPAINSSSSLSAAAGAASPSMLLKSLLSSSHQDFTVPKQCKTEANYNFSHFQLPPPDDADNLNYWMQKITSNQNPYQNPLFFEMGCGNFQVSSTTAGDTSASTVYDMFAPVGSQMM